MKTIDREQALQLLMDYNHEKYHIQHALTVEAIMRWFANELGYDIDYWGIVGLLHDLDYEQYPNEHCVKVVDILRAKGYPDEVIHSICSHGYNLVVDVQPKHDMEKVLYAVDELSGIIGAAAKMRPSGSVADMELSSLKKKYKTKAFAAGCSREVIAYGAEMLGWDLDCLLSMTLEAMRASEQEIAKQMEKVASA